MQRPDFRELVTHPRMLLALMILSISIAGCAYKEPIHDCGGYYNIDWSEQLHLRESEDILRIERIGELSIHNDQLRLVVSKDAQEPKLASSATPDALAILTHNGEYTFTLGTTDQETGLTNVDYTGHCYTFTPQGQRMSD
ncbi:MAG: hypothetical protein NUV65_00325 [Candidatus Roizmanbacteria bacterium]|nr:hypothetical protein [Candidatus Roizmanbacteria bacterium]